MKIENDLITISKLLGKMPAFILSTPGLLKALMLGRISDQTKPVGLGVILEETAAKYGDNTALMFEDFKINYRDFNGWVNQIANYFIEKGLKKGDAVALLFENRPELLACVAGIAKAGGVNAMLNTSLSGPALSHSISLAKPKFVIIGAELAESFRDIRLELELADEAVYCLADQNTLADPGEDVEGYVNLAQEIKDYPTHNPATTNQVYIKDLCFYVYTSGTTGLPKAARFTHGRLIKAYGAFGHGATRMQPGEVMYSTMPLYHSTAMVICWGPCLVSGAGFAFRRKFSASEFWNDTRRFKAQCFGYVGEICRYLMNVPPQPNDIDNPVYKIVGTGLRPNIWKEFKARFGIEKVFESYASSEGPTGFINLLNFDNSVGVTSDSFAIVKYDKEREEPLLNAAGYMEKVKKGEAGLLISEISEKTGFDGYTQKAKNEDCVFHDVFKKGDYYYNSGDYMRHLGFRHLQFVDRLGDTYRWKGENVSTTEVENVISEFGNIAESIAYGVKIPGTNGRAGMSVLVFKDLDQPLDGQLLYQHLQETLPPYAIPLFLRIRGQSDITGTFKYKKNDLKEEGFDLKKVEEPLYALVPGSKKYEILTPEMYENIMSGEYRY